ncbi:MAG: hypothetical protein L0Y39_03045, partial [Methylococcaceae bacterium]|nr:hypothetical protein [Methylococcaceae bacterium]
RKPAPEAMRAIRHPSIIPPTLFDGRHSIMHRGFSSIVSFTGNDVAQIVGKKLSRISLQQDEANGHIAS